MIDFLMAGIENLKHPAILFFILGFIATLIKTEIKFPEQIAKGLSYFLMIAIGFKGGAEIAKSGINESLFLSTGLSIFLASLIPVMAFFLLKTFLKTDAINAGALAAHYGSVSVVTFVTATAYLGRQSVDYSGFMVGMMAVMEFPAILIGLGLAKYFGDIREKEFDVKNLIRESLTNESVVILAGAMLIGFVSGENGYKLTRPLFVDAFPGILTFFLLEMGVLSAKKISDFRLAGVKIILFGIFFPLFNGIFAASICALLNISPGNATLFAVLAASSSYIAAPAAVRLVLPQANPSIYLTSSLAVTFPFNIILGIPVYYLAAVQFTRMF